MYSYTFIRVFGVIGSTAGSNPVGQGSSPWGRANGDVAQLVEQRTENPCVEGSIPSITTIIG